VPAVADLLKQERDLPGWLARKNAVGHVSRLPERSDISEVIEEQLVVEYYSR
jgi:ribosomal protein S4